jgi:hypothetical protein
MPFNVILFGWKRARNTILLVDRDLFRGPKTMRKKLLNRLAREGRDQTRKNITAQGPGWAPLSKWTVARTGKKKALLSARPKVGVVRANPAGTRSATVFRSPGDWTLTQHHDGFREGPASGPMKIPLKRPKALGLPPKTPFIILPKRGEVKVPARPVWPEGAQLRRLMSRNLRIWRAEFVRRIKRVR